MPPKNRTDPTKKPKLGEGTSTETTTEEEKNQDKAAAGPN